MTTPPQNLVPVTQVDREAMIAYEKEWPIGLADSFVRRIRAGEHDTDGRIQAFARHRLTAHKEGEAQGMEKAAGIAADYRDNAGGSQSYKQACGHIIDAIGVASHDQ